MYDCIEMERKWGTAFWAPFTMMTNAMNSHCIGGGISFRFGELGEGTRLFPLRMSRTLFFHSYGAVDRLWISLRWKKEKNAHDQRLQSNNRKIHSHSILFGFFSLDIFIDQTHCTYDARLNSKWIQMNCKIRFDEVCSSFLFHAELLSRKHLEWRTSSLMPNIRNTFFSFHGLQSSNYPLHKVQHLLDEQRLLH